MGEAQDEREQWRREMLKGKPSEEITSVIRDYEALSKDATWRASRFVEILGEAAVIWLQNLEKSC